MSRQTARKSDPLRHLENSLLSPLVPGEIESWIDSVQAASESFSKLLECQINEVHAETYQAIASEDPELFAKVERLRQEDANLVVAIRQFEAAVSKFARKATGSAADERAIDEQREELVNLGVALVRRVRTQELAINTWHQEALLRDRGVAD